MRFSPLALLAGAAILLAPAAHAQKQYGPGVTDTEIKIGQTMVYSGPASSFGIVGEVMRGYAAMVNDKGGIKGRKVTVLSYDDACSPPKTIEATRRLVENDNVLGLFGSTCTGSQIAVQKYLNGKQVPQFYTTGSGATLFDPKGAPWTIPMSFYYELEGENYGRYIRQAKPNAKIAILFQNDDVGKSLIRGFKKGLGGEAVAATMVVKEASYEATDPTIDSQILVLKGSGADTFANFGVLKFATMALKKTQEIGWKPMQVIMTTSSSVPGVLAQAGPLKESVGLITGSWYKASSDPKWANDEGVNAYKAFMKARLPGKEMDDAAAVHGYLVADLTFKLLERAGDNLTRENLLKQATSMTNVELPMLLPGITVNASPDNYYVIRTAKMSRFDGTRWALVD
ncbi:unannotated protein [freshwater metagenome]|uniref:Unannotated protein n=1 Tax=freshwater metagenome TaxID=449393 RepID=A0A6J7AL66_9ZZZZ|nr:ABC transporter substrate-binding protein [Actinomycetota bacterium]